jgi:hypothetical protein
MHYEVQAAMLQRLSLQLVTALNGSPVDPDVLIKHIERMYGLAIEYRQAIKNAEREGQAEAEKPN